MREQPKTERPVLQAQGLTKVYAGRVEQVEVFRDLHFSIARGEMVAVTGVSGSGKSTLLQILGLLDQATAGTLIFDQIDTAKFTELDLARIRNEQIGFVFQFHHLLPEFTALENVMMPLLIAGVSPRLVRERARELLDGMGLGHRLPHRPGELSGGERQRAALARALARGPALLLADEPTGNLDQRTGDEMGMLLQRAHRQSGLTSVIVTHNERLAALCDRVLLLEAGGLRETGSGLETG
ncbi:MAG: ABC transporter ATP-binding protein [Blastocatellia bacterium]